MYRYGHHAVPIQMMVTAAKNTTILDPNTVSIGTVSIQTLTDTYRYGHHAVLIQMMVTAAQTTTIPNPKLFVSHLIFI